MLKKNILGKTGIEVSELCFGALTIGPLQANLSIDEGADVLIEAFGQGINFVDTAMLYKTYPYIKRAIKKYGVKPVIATKTYAWNREKAKESLEDARRELDLDYVDIFLLHEQESVHTIRGHMEAMEYFLEAKQKGIIRAFGISTHHVEAVKATFQFDDIEIIHPIINKAGIGICDGDIVEMLKYVKLAYDKGKGIYSMKPLGGGNLIGTYDEALSFVRSIDCVHSVAIGMQTVEEVLMNVSFLKGKRFRKRFWIKPRKNIESFILKVGVRVAENVF